MIFFIYFIKFNKIRVEKGRGGSGLLTLSKHSIIVLLKAGHNSFSQFLIMSLSDTLSYIQCTNA